MVTWVVGCAQIRAIISNQMRVDGEQSQKMFRKIQSSLITSLSKITTVVIINDINLRIMTNKQN